MNKPPLVTSEKSIFNLMQVINDTIQYAETVEQTLLAAIREVVAGEGVEIAPVPDASASVKGIVTLADSTTDPELYAVSVALLNAVVGQIGQTTGNLVSLGTTNKTNLVNAINEVKNATTDTAGYVGNLQGLNTTAKANLVAAINEVKSLAGTDYSTVIGVLNTLTTTAKNNLVSAINEVQSNQGALNGLNTTAKTNLIGAINEVKTKADGVGTLTSLTTTAKSNLVVAINEVLTLAGDLATLSTTAKSNLVGAINELNTSIGSLSSLTTTTKTSLVSAINELKTSIGNLASLTTTAKTSTVLAINEVKTLADSAHTKVGTLASLTTTEKNSLVGALNEVKQYANDGKTAIATAVTAKGVTASPADTFSSLATKIGQIPTDGGGGGTGGSISINGATDVQIPAGENLLSGDIAGIKWDLNGNYQEYPLKQAIQDDSGISSFYQLSVSKDGSHFAFSHYNSKYIVRVYTYNKQVPGITLVQEIPLDSDDQSDNPKIFLSQDGSYMMIASYPNSTYTTRVAYYTKSGGVYTKISEGNTLGRYIATIDMHPTIPVYFVTNYDGAKFQSIFLEDHSVGTSVTDPSNLPLYTFSEDYTMIYISYGNEGFSSYYINSYGMLLFRDSSHITFNFIGIMTMSVLGNYLYVTYISDPPKKIDLTTGEALDTLIGIQSQKLLPNGDRVASIQKDLSGNDTKSLVLLDESGAEVSLKMVVFDTVYTVIICDDLMLVQTSNSTLYLRPSSGAGLVQEKAYKCNNLIDSQYSAYCLAMDTISVGSMGSFKKLLQ